MNKLIHQISHWFGWNGGEVVTFWRGRRLMVGFRCDGCGAISGLHESRITKDSCND